MLFETSSDQQGTLVNEAKSVAILKNIMIYSDQNLLVRNEKVKIDFHLNRLIIGQYVFRHFKYRDLFLMPSTCFTDFMC